MFVGVAAQLVAVAGSAGRNDGAGRREGQVGLPQLVGFSMFGGLPLAVGRPRWASVVLSVVIVRPRPIHNPIVPEGTYPGRE
jgi:hypothetical protein